MKATKERKQNGMTLIYVMAGIAYIAITAKIDKNFDALYIGKGTR